MRTEFEIRDRIEYLVSQIYDINAKEHSGSYLIEIDEKKKKLELFKEVANLFWVLGEDIPKKLFEVL